MQYILTKTDKKHGKSEGIVLLRGIVCVYIVACHLFGGWYQSAERGFSYITKFITLLAHVSQPIAETNAGVIFFIVLSGYCIHRNGFSEVNKDNVIFFYKKRLARILPVFISSLMIGIILWKYTFNNYITNTLTATNAFSPMAAMMRIIGINTLIPWRYQQTFLGNAPLCTVIVETYIYIFYPIICKLDERYCVKWKIAFFVLWGGILLISVQTGNRNWWENMCVFNFIPLWYIGALFNNRGICSGKKWMIYSVFMGVIYCFLYIPFRIMGSSFALVLISEIRKFILAFMMALLIRYVDEHGEKLFFMTFGLLDIGTISYSIYAIHGPVIIWMLGAKIDIITLLIGLWIFSILEYCIFERHMSEYLMKKLIKT